MKELNDYFPEGLEGNGIFKAIANISWFPGVQPGSLDTYFFLKHGQKLASSICKRFENEDGIITGDKLRTLAQMIHNAYITNWEHEYKTLTVEYNPIENTDYVETYEGEAHGKAGGDTKQSGGTTSENERQGLGSSSYVDDSKNTLTYNNVKSEASSTSDGTDKHTIHKHGNIGVTTNSQMIVSDIEAWKLNKFYDILCKDICDTLALSIF